MAALEEEGLALTDPVTGEDSESEVEAVGGLNVCLAQVMSDSVSCVGRLAILPEAAPTMRHLGNGTMTRQIPRGQGKAAHLPRGQRVPDLR